MFGDINPSTPDSATTSDESAKTTTKCPRCLAKEAIIGVAEKLIGEMGHSLKALDTENERLRERVEVLNESSRRKGEELLNERHKASRAIYDVEHLRKELDETKRRREQETFNLKQEVDGLRETMHSRTIGMAFSIGIAAATWIIWIVQVLS